MSDERTIAPLDDETVRRIAAGEVVERPASAVKELVENAVDAEADRISVGVESGGTEGIRVRDDGVGMTAAELELAVQEHTTSKIDGIDDLEAGVGTLGFRGEALHTIGAVSRLTIRSRSREGDGPGHELPVEGGDAGEVRPVGCPRGTVVEVEDLFYNTPAREKFLASESTEFDHVSRVVAQYALANPDVAVSLEHDGREVFATQGDGSRRSAVLAVYGREVAESMVEVEWERDGDGAGTGADAAGDGGGRTVEAAPEGGPIRRITGLVSDPETTRSTREYVSTFVDGRYVTATTLREGVVDAYGGQVASDRYPFAALFVAVDPGAVDVNVHPRKMEVRFDDEAGARAAVETAVREALLDHGLVRSRAPRGRSAPEETPVDPERPDGEVVGGAGASADPGGSGTPTDDSTLDDATADSTLDDATADSTLGDATADSTPDDVTADSTPDDVTADSTLGDATADSTLGDATADSTLDDAAGVEGDDFDGEAESSPADAGGTPSDGGSGFDDWSVSIGGDDPVPADDGSAPGLDANPEPATDSEPAADPEPAANDATAQGGGDPSSGSGGGTVDGTASQRTLDGDAVDPGGAFDRLPKLRVLGQIEDTYVVCEGPDGLVLIDQHAADERVNYERLRERLDGAVASQRLADPVELSLTAREAALFDAHDGALSAVGFEAERVDDRTVAVEAVPAAFDATLEPALLREALSAFVDEERAGAVDDAVDDLLADLACYPSITGNTSLTEGSVSALLAALDDCENPYACPHGRPVIVGIDGDEIAARFERDYPGHG